MNLITPKTSSISEIFQFVFCKWIDNNPLVLKNKSIATYCAKYPSFPTLDDWRTASKEDFYIEKTSFQFTNLEALGEYMEIRWMEEIGEDGLEEIGTDAKFLYEESASVFNRALTAWNKKEIEQLECERE